MLKKIALTFLLFQVLTSHAVEKPKDSFGPKNLIETGLTGMNFFNHHGFYILDPLFNGYISYTRVILPQHFFVKIDHHAYDITYRRKQNAAGAVAMTSAHIARLSIGKVWVYKKWRFSPYVSLDYRKGYGDWVQLAKAYMNPPYGIFPYKSLGAGIGGSVNYRIGERFMVGLETHLDYFFQKSNSRYLDTYTNEWVKYEPDNTISISHLKIGLLF